MSLRWALRLWCLAKHTALSILAHQHDFNCCFFFFLFYIRKVGGVVTHEPVGYAAALAIGIMAGGAAGTLSADK